MSSERLKFLEQITDAELRRDIATILLNLIALSEMPAARIGKSSPSAEHEYAGPPKTGSLHDDFMAQFQNALPQGELALYKVLWRAQKAYNDLVVPFTQLEREEKVAAHLARHDDQLLREAILNLHEGNHSHKVHIELNLSEGWIQHVRSQAGRDPIWGTPKIAWKGSDEQKRAVVEGLKNAGVTQQEAAQKLSVSVRTVQAHWPKGEAA